MIETIVQDSKDRVAMDYLLGQILQAFMEAPPVPLRANELVAHLHELPLNTALLRAVLLNEPTRFLQEERRWLPLYRKVSPRLSLTAFVERLVRAVGLPLSLEKVARECGVHYKRSYEYYETILPRVCQNSETLFCTPSRIVGLREWLFLPDWIEPIPYEWERAEERERAAHDALFYNNLTWSEVETYLKRARKLDWHQPDTPVQFLEQIKAPLSNRILGFLSWYLTLSPDPRWVYPYDPVDIFDRVHQLGKFVWGPDEQWYPASVRTEWLERALQLATELHHQLPEEEMQPLELRPDEVEHIVHYILQQPGIVHAAQLLEEMFEVSPTSRTFKEDLDTLISALISDRRIEWFGYDRFGRTDHIPPYVRQVPPVFDFPPLPDIRNEQGEPYDIVLVEEAFPRSLRQEFRDPRAQDVNDEEQAVVPEFIPNKVRIVLRPPHKDLGTIPLCQIPPGFFEDAPDIQQFTFIDEQERAHEVWLNTQARLIFGLFERFAELDVISGAIFELHKTDRPDVFRFIYTDMVDPLLAISHTRYQRLLDLQAKADQMSTYHILIEVMRLHPTGADFLTLHNEVNVVRRTKRELTASLLSAYPCFELHKGSTVWHLVEEEINKPIRKKARSYIMPQEVES
ncbi:hypothetical protein HRbin15_02195 [bacterium HR15]|nr:hypothetical protein HRbin15_02195 [bacterium HR15]